MVEALPDGEETMKDGKEELKDGDEEKLEGLEAGVEVLADDDMALETELVTVGLDIVALEVMLAVPEVTTNMLDIVEPRELGDMIDVLKLLEGLLETILLEVCERPVAEEVVLCPTICDWDVVLVELEEPRLCVERVELP